jgi:hypothetical protein
MIDLYRFIKGDLKIAFQGLAIAAATAAGFILYANIWG